MSNPIRDFHLNANTRWPEEETVDDWRQGAPLAAVRSLCDHWLNHYDWRRCEARLNGFDQHLTEIDGLDIHFLHIRSPHADALPLIMTHGWPGSVVEFLDVIEPLTDPTAHGGAAEDAFHLVNPSLPATDASAARLYWESMRDRVGKPMDMAVGISIFPRELFRPSRRWVKKVYPSLIYWNEVEKGGHFAAFEQPALFPNELRACFRMVR